MMMMMMMMMIPFFQGFIFGGLSPGAACFHGVVVVVYSCNRGEGGINMARRCVRAGWVDSGG